MKKIIADEIKKHIAVVAVGGIYLGFVLAFGVGIPCPFNLVTGLKCPSCGITKMFVHLAKLDFAAAFAQNPAIFTTLPILIVVYIIELMRYIKSGKRKLTKLSNAVVIAEIVILAAYAVIRNIK